MKENFNNTAVPASNGQTCVKNGCTQEKTPPVSKNAAAPGTTAGKSKKNDDRDGLLGGLIFDAFLGTAFMHALSDGLGVTDELASVDWSNAADMGDEIWMDRARPAPRASKPGMAKFSMDQRGDLTSLFAAPAPARKPAAEDEAIIHPAWHVPAAGRGTYALSMH